MTIRQGFPDEHGTFDVCVVGSGPAGLAVALACGRRGQSVIVLEAGTEVEGAATFEPIRILDELVHAPLDVTTRARFGGTSAAWGGLCVPYDPIDFEERDWVPSARWPIAFSDIAPWTAAAAQFLDCGTGFEDGHEHPLATETLDMTQSGRLARRAALGPVYRMELATSRSITVCLGTSVSGIACDPTGRHVVGVDVVSAGGAGRIRSHHVVVAAGGLRTTRLLLALARAWPRHFAAGRAPLGRYYMGHLTGEVATIAFRDPRQAADFLFKRGQDGHWRQRRLKPTSDLQRAQRLLGTAFTLRAPQLTDHRHRDGALSAIILLGAIPGIGAKLNSGRLRAAVAQLGPNERFAHLRNVLGQPAATSVAIGTLLRQMRIENLPLVALNRSGRYALRFHAEHAPRLDSGVRLDDEDVTRLLVDFRYHHDDVDSVVRAHHWLDAVLRQHGIGHLEFRAAGADLHEAVRAQSRDGYHQIGTARMSDAPHSGIVDGECRVHGFENLHVASACTFPTAGSANPTLTVVAMALRLADGLCRASSARPTVSTVPQAISA